MRLFVAIDLSKEIKDYLFNLQKEIGNQYAKIRWMGKSQLHLTLKFLGDIPEDRVRDVKELLSKITFSKFKLKLLKIGIYPNETKINVIWVGVEPENEVVNLQKLVDSETMGFGDIKLGGHITLGRIKFVKDKNKLKGKIKDVKVKGLTFDVDNFCLFSSVLNKDGPTYTLVRRYALN